VIRLGGLELASPWALLLLALPLWWWLRRRRPPAIVFSRVGALAAGPRVGRGIARTLFTLRNLELAAVVVALAWPRSGARAENVTSEGINIMISFNCLEVAREKVQQFVALRTTDRIGTRTETWS